MECLTPRVDLGYASLIYNIHGGNGLLKMHSFELHTYRDASRMSKGRCQSAALEVACSGLRTLGLITASELSLGRHRVHKPSVLSVPMRNG